MLPFTATTASKLLYSPLVLPIRSIKGVLVPLPSGNIPETPINWKKPEKVRIWHPRRSLDGVPALKVDMNMSPIIVEKSEELKTADEFVKRLFTFHFLGRKYAMRRAKIEMIESVRNHNYDYYSREVSIARKTATIRNLTEHILTNKATGKTKKYFNELILSRKKSLRLLRQWDYKRFEWLLEKLDLYFQGPHEVFFRTRQKSIRHLTKIYCEDFKAKKLLAYQQQLEDERENFLKNKVETLEWIRKEEHECGVEPTVSEEDIKAARKQLDDHLEYLSQKVVVIDTTQNIIGSV